uniref:Uncharacterized protein n=1 Tax=Physcomitrium patens TaxID=3218 RepID=A0A2K1IX64_PHYPA|nr:hypothetical protein PHYPA_023689 [Physcomitrium patens]
MDGITTKIKVYLNMYTSICPPTHHFEAKAIVST